MPAWRRYVPVAERRAKARREADKLRKQGKTVHPVTIEGRSIARSFWGRAWCTHLASFSDFANRLPRGRTYVRNGSVCHLDIKPGAIEALVIGSRRYRVAIGVERLDGALWQAVRERCAGHIGSLLELLQGTLSDHVMAIVTDRRRGLFPQPNEMTLSCSCPDWAVMCKHVAAVLYGVGHRLDSEPELLFRLRGVDPQALIAVGIALPSAGSEDDTLAPGQLGDIFGIELDTEPATAGSDQASTGARRARHSGSLAMTRLESIDSAAPGEETAAAMARRAPVRVRASVPRRPTGKSIARLRQQRGLSVAQFARELGVSPASVYRWEATPGRLNLRVGTIDALAGMRKPAKRK